MFIGDFKFHNLLTLMNIFMGNLTLYFLFTNKYRYVFICMIICGILDLFDGKFANSFNRTDTQKIIGIELDSLADTFCSVINPAIVILFINNFSLLSFIISILITMCGIMRLAVFNENAFSEERNNYFIGLPVLYSILILVLGVIFISVFHLPLMLINIAAIVMAIAFILNVKIKKPGKLTYIVMCSLAIFSLAYLIFC